MSLQWRHNERDGVSNHQRLDCLLNRLCRRRSKKTSKLSMTGLCEVNSPVTSEFPAQRASNEVKGSIWWRYHLRSWTKGWMCFQEAVPPNILQYLELFEVGMRPGPWFSIKMSSYQYRKSHCGDETVVRSSHLHDEISYSVKMPSLYWIGPWLCFLDYVKSHLYVCAELLWSSARKQRATFHI